MNWRVPGSDVSRAGPFLCRFSHFLARCPTSCGGVPPLPGQMTHILWWGPPTSWVRCPASCGGVPSTSCVRCPRFLGQMPRFLWWVPPLPVSDALLPVVGCPHFLCRMPHILWWVPPLPVSDAPTSCGGSCTPCGGFPRFLYQMPHVLWWVPALPVPDAPASCGGSPRFLGQMPPLPGSDAPLPVAGPPAFWVRCPASCGGFPHFCARCAPLLFWAGRWVGLALSPAAFRFLRLEQERPRWGELVPGEDGVLLGGGADCKVSKRFVEVRAGSREP